MPAGFAETGIAQPTNTIVVLLYKVRGWDGVPDALEGGEVGWFTQQQVLALAKPPLDVMLAQQLFQNC